MMVVHTDRSGIGHQPSQARAETERRAPREPARLVSQFSRSFALYDEAKKHLPAGASSNIRVYAHDPFPILFEKGKGSRVWDVDDNEYVDLLSSYGAIILGHSHPVVLQAINRQLQNGTMLGTTTELELEVAKKIQSAVPCAEMVSFANTGTEATMEAIRIARAITGRDKILRFEGHYHGHHDYVLFSVESPWIVAGLEQAPSKLPYYPGIPDGISRTVVVAQWNDPVSLERVLKTERERPRSNNHRARDGQRRNNSSEGRIPQIGSRARRQIRRSPHLRRGAHRIPDRTRRSPRILRSQT